MTPNNEELLNDLIEYGESISPVIKSYETSAYWALAPLKAKNERAISPVCLKVRHTKPFLVEIQKGIYEQLPPKLKALSFTAPKGDPHLRGLLVSSDADIKHAKALIAFSVDKMLEEPKVKDRLTLVNSIIDEERADHSFQSEVMKELTIDSPYYEEENQKMGEMPKKPSVTSSKRNPKVAVEALKRSGFMCEYDSSHAAFISKKTNRNFVEAHHLIPLALQARFEYLLDRTSNIVALCPNCHRRVHHSKDSKEIFEFLYQKRMADIELDHIIPKAGSMEDLIEEFGGCL